jgi:hypothetical protein
VNPLLQLTERRAYVLGTLANTGEGAAITGFQFQFFCFPTRLYLYATQGFELTVDGHLIDNASITVLWNGRWASAARLHQSEFMVAQGEVVSIETQLPGGLEPGKRHRIAVRHMSGGGYGVDKEEGRIDRWFTLVDFEDSVA